ncbi:MAG TPA: hypothetical protein VEZ52_07080 [Desulfovibrio sp.]|uniref:hypothetical protein n=1 Tax=Desulfovibrio sp. TaxID=885 RepID=UPI002D54A5B6|nr:hypothetical protein [Desulfovibrio sp.]HZF61370.1 hypothetical protein [Desulfovibrio sp.]
MIPNKAITAACLCHCFITPPDLNRLPCPLPVNYVKMLLIINILLCKQPIGRGQRWHDILGTVIIGEALASDLLIFHAATGNSLNLLFKKQKDRTAPQPSGIDAGFNTFWMRKKRRKVLATAQNGD